MGRASLLRWRRSAHGGVDESEPSVEWSGGAFIWSRPDGMRQKIECGSAAVVGLARTVGVADLRGRG